MTASSCPHAWFEPLRALFTDIGLASGEYLRAELMIQLILINLAQSKYELTILESVTPCYAGAQRFLNWGLSFSLLDISQAYDILVFTSKTAKSPSIDEATGLRE